ncbi:OmpA family protein [Shewanella sp.]|uniref:MotY family protein n=1 Tax=Shewanella sp. TaxID=50422 RepID=UPI003A96FF08
MLVAKLSCVGLLLVSFSYISTVRASEQWKQSYENGAWSIKQSSFECRLSQRLAGVGEVSLQREPEHATKLVFALEHPDAAATEAAIQIQNADWKKEADQVNPTLATGHFVDSKVEFFDIGSEVLDAIAAGDWLSFAYLQHERRKNVLFTNTSGADAVISFRQCLSEMAPISWNTARESEFYFATGKSTISSAQDLELLKNIVRYISLDRNVTKVLIDGYTDNVGNNTANRVLSQQRADDVASRLVEFGMESSLLEVRAHGSRYPVINNKTLEQGLNRRVTIRLIRKNNG